MGWYGVEFEELAGDAVKMKLDNTHPVQFNIPKLAPERGEFRKEIDPGETSVLGRGSEARKLPFTLLGGFDARHHRCGLIGSEDWSMYPILQPGSVVIIDETRRKIARGGWSDEMDRPIYFLEHRQGFICGWCAQSVDRLIVLAHPSSPEPPRIFSYPRDIDVVGQVVAVTTPMNGRTPRPAHTAPGPSASPNP
jgi:hypothetical protein